MRCRHPSKGEHMNTREIEHMWKVASNNPNHDTNWHDPVVVAFAKMVAAHTLMNIDPSGFMSHQEGIEAGRLAEREACADVVESTPWSDWFRTDCAAAIRARGNT
jgi:hypothetical protein